MFAMDLFEGSSFSLLFMDSISTYTTGRVGLEMDQPFNPNVAKSRKKIHAVLVNNERPITNDFGD